MHGLHLTADLTGCDPTQLLMRERNRLASAIEGVEKLEQDVADTVELIDMAEADGDALDRADDVVGADVGRPVRVRQPCAQARRQQDADGDFQP